jgi:hypothetical protein
LHCGVVGWMWVGWRELHCGGVDVGWMWGGCEVERVALWRGGVGEGCIVAWWAGCGWVVGWRELHCGGVDVGGL